MANEGLVWDPRSQKHNNPGSDWNPGQGDNPIYTLPETNIAPEMGGWNTTFLLGFGLFSGALAVSFREGTYIEFL